MPTAIYDHEAETVTITMSSIEAAAVLCLCEAVSGDSRQMGRRQTEAVGSALRSSGVVALTLGDGSFSFQA